MGAFNRRRSRGVGAFITRSEIEKRHASTLSELLRYLPGVGVQQRMPASRNRFECSGRRIRPCRRTVLCRSMSTGIRTPNGNVDDFAPNGVEGVEVYRSASEIPADFRTRGATCGVIAIWTRDPEAARQQP